MCNLCIMNFDGLIIGGATFLIIGLCHPLVIKGEYYFGVRLWIAFLVCGLGFCALSVFIKHNVLSIIFGVCAFSLFWGIKELFEQKKRVEKGLYPKREKKEKK